MINPDEPKLSVVRQCHLAGLARSSYYYEPVPLSQWEHEVMRCIDEIFTRFPFYGSRRMSFVLQKEGICAGRDRVRRLMSLLGLQAVAPGPNTSKPAPGHVIYPYLLRNREVRRPGEVWATDITYIRLARGFVYLVVHMDWFSRYVLSWRLSTTMDTYFCIQSLMEALDKFSQPEVHNSDQGVQFTSGDYTRVLKDAGVAISMDGRGRWVDNVFVERLWRSLKYECVYLRDFQTPQEAERQIGEYFEFYNDERPHQTFSGATPREVWSGERTVDIANARVNNSFAH